MEFRAKAKHPPTRVEDTGGAWFALRLDVGASPSLQAQRWDASSTAPHRVIELFAGVGGFPRGFTRLDGVNDIARARLMGNALITGLVARIGAAMVDRAPAPAPTIAIQRAPSYGPRTRAECTVIHMVSWNLVCGSGDNVTKWKASIGLTGDLACHLYAVPLGKSRSYRRSRAMSASFYSIMDMRDKFWTLLLKKHLPIAVIARWLAAIPDFVSDAEAAYHSGQYYSRPDDRT